MFEISVSQARDLAFLIKQNGDLDSVCAKVWGFESQDTVLCTYTYEIIDKIGSLSSHMRRQDVTSVRFLFSHESGITPVCIVETISMLLSKYVMKFNSRHPHLIYEISRNGTRIPNPSPYALFLMIDDELRLS